MKRKQIRRWSLIPGLLLLSLASCRNEHGYDKKNEGRDRYTTSETTPLRNEETLEDGHAEGEPMDSADQYFLVQAAMTDLKEIEMGKLSQKKGSSDGVRSFGRMLVEDHTKSLHEVQALGEQAGAAIPGTIDEQAVKEQETLYALEGKAFDQKFAQMMVEGHQQAIALMKRAARDAGQDRIKKWASAKIPVLTSHLEHAEMLQKSVEEK